MAYNENIPQSTDNPSQSQSQMLGNFQEISTAFNLNHGNFNAANQGKHDIINLIRQSLPKASNANEGLLFGAVINGATELFYGKDSANGAQVTNILPTSGGGTPTSFSWNFASGLKLRFGLVNHSGTFTRITFNSAFPNAAYAVLFSPLGAASLVNGNNIQFLTTVDFTLNSASSAPGGSQYYYIALGR